ncbi:MAG: hypothetical protein ACK2UC_01640 [Anaerolineae bacterium]|jgi:hypothetical protein
MNLMKRALTILLIVAIMVLAFWAGTTVASGSDAAAPQALTPAQWAAVQAANSLLLDQGPTSIYLPVVLRH